MQRAIEKIPRRWLLVGYGVVLGLITLALAYIAYRAMYSYWDVPDDDGYLLMSLRKFDAGGSLYTDVYSQYGPGVFVLLGSVLRAIGVALTNDGARAVNLALWLGSTLLIGLALLRLTRSFWASAAGLLVGFLLLKVDANEPLHPGATIAFLLIAIVAAAAFLLPARPRAALATIGALAAALVSLKVNVGLLVLASIAFACVLTVPALRPHLWLRVVAVEVAVAIPFVLVNEHLGTPQELRFAVIVAIGVLAVGITSFRLPAASPPSGRDLWTLVAATIAVLLVVALVPLLAGTSLHDLIQGWVVRPAKTPGIQWISVLVNPRALVLGGAGLAAAVAVALLWGRGLARGALAQLLLGAGRILVGVAIWVALSGPVFHFTINLTQGMFVGAPFLWVAMLDPKGPSPRTSFVRALVPALAALQFLHAYPVPGSQLTWGSVLLVIVGGICVADGCGQLARVGAGWRPKFVAWPALAAVPVIAFVAWFCLKPLRTEARQVRAAYSSGVSLDLPGARDLRLNEPLALQLEGLVAGLRQSCDTFLTLPGMNSLNILSGEEPPVEVAGPWPFFLEAPEQQKIVDEVRDIPRFCVVYKPDLLEFWAGSSGNEVPKRPLVTYIEKEFVVKRNYSGYYLMVPRSSLPGTSGAG
jgi:hypothetical protein